MSMASSCFPILMVWYGRVLVQRLYYRGGAETQHRTDIKQRHPCFWECDTRCADVLRRRYRVGRGDNMTFLDLLHHLHEHGVILFPYPDGMVRTCTCATLVLQRWGGNATPHRHQATAPLLLGV